jgi:putative addiction module component (TIGR02574 family)
MPRTAAELLEEARKLPRHQQRWIGHELLEEEEETDSPEEIEAAWADEVERRLNEIDSGKVKMIPLEEVLAEMYATTTR